VNISTLVRGVMLGIACLSVTTIFAAAPDGGNLGACDGADCQVVATPMRFVNRRTGQCLDVAQARMADGTNVVQRPCNGGANQSWSYDDTTGLIHSTQDPRYCLDNSGTYSDGANIRVWSCNGSGDQRFTFDPTIGKIAMRNFTDQVVDASGPDAGAHVITWSFWGGGNQLWNMVP
jgi:hypothetical protein